MTKLRDNFGCKNFKSNVKGMGTFLMIFNNSSNIEEKGYYGISHLIEHCMCEPLKQYELEFEKYGINYNAATHFRFVDFYLTGLDEGIIKFRETFYNLICNYHITKEVFEREKLIVLQEYNDSLSIPDRVFIENVFRKYFYTRTPIGEMEDIKNITYEKFIEYKNKFFNKPSCICNTSSKKINKLKFKTSKHGLDQGEIKHNDDYHIDLVNGVVGETSRIIGYFSKFKYNMETLEEFIYYSLISDYLSFGLSSPLYKELREDTGHVYSIYSNCETIFDNGEAAFIIYLKTDPEYEDDIRSRLLNCLNKNLLNIDKDIFDSITISIKNRIKRTRLLSFVNRIGFLSKYEQICEKYEYDFEKFKSYAEKFLKNDFILINNVTY